MRCNVRKLVKLLLIFSLLIGMSACSSVNISGLENYGIADCSYELSRDLFPDESFLSSFEYYDGNYVLESKDGLSDGQSTAFAFLTYSPEIYERAKRYCIDNLVLCDEHQFAYAGFEFMERLSHFIRNDDGALVVGCRYPDWFNMFAYCDATCTLIFLGYYNTDSEVNELAQSDFPSFVERVYSKYYNFNES